MILKTEFTLTTQTRSVHNNLFKAINTVITNSKKVAEMLSVHAIPIFLRRVSFWSLLVMGLLAAPMSLATPASAGPAPVALGPSVVALNGPWKFRIGDNPVWADPSFDDSGWEAVDLTPPSNAHDPDVGLTNYVPGWAAKGHAGYWGYAWYRSWVAVTAQPGSSLALAGPPDVDSAYQIFLNGELLGSAGKFSGSSPAAYSIQPRVFRLPQSLAAAIAAGKPALLAIRVWMGPWEIGDPQGGGIHIAPALGETGAIEAQYQIQWLQTFRGYIVEVVEPFLFLLLAVMAGCLFVFDRSDHAYVWLIIGLCLVALVRLNQAVFFWGQFETVHGYELVSVVLLTPTCMTAWTLAWRAWFRLQNAAWISKAVGGLLLVYVMSSFLTCSWFYGVFPHWVGAAAGFAISASRWLFALLTAVIVWQGLRRQGREGWIALPAILLISTGLFASELSALHIRGIWFPFGTGVSRSQFAYAGFDVALFLLLLRRLMIFAQRYRQAAREAGRVEVAQAV